MFYGKSLRVCVALGFLLLSVVSVQAQAGPDGVKEALAREGFCNIRIAQNDSVSIYTIQNDAYKLQASGIAAATRVLEREGALQEGTVKLIVTDCDIPQVTLTYCSSTGEWKVSHLVDREEWRAVKADKKTNSAFGKVDINVYPQVSLMNLIITQVYQSLWQLSPAVETTLWPGARFSYQVKFPIFNDGYGSRESKVHPGMITLSQRFRLPCDFLGKASVGVFSNSRYGFSLDLKRRFKSVPWLTAEGGFQVLGLCYFEGFTFHMAKEFHPHWYLGGNAYWPRISTEFRGRVQKFLLHDYGVKGEVIRHFRHCSIGLYVEKGFSGYAHTNGGFRFQIALPPYRYKRPGNWPRVNTAGQIGMVYNANNEQSFYKEAKYEASDNIMSENAFNPYYIEREVKRLNELEKKKEKETN